MNLFRSEGSVNARQTARMESRAARTQQRGIRAGGRQWRGLFGTMSRGVTASRGGFRGMFGMVARGAVRLGTLIAGELLGGARVPGPPRVRTPRVRPRDAPLIPLPAKGATAVVAKVATAALAVAPLAVGTALAVPVVKALTKPALERAEQKDVTGERKTAFETGAQVLDKTYSAFFGIGKKTPEAVAAGMDAGQPSPSRVPPIA